MLTVTSFFSCAPPPCHGGQCREVPPGIQYDIICAMGRSPQDHPLTDCGFMYTIGLKNYTHKYSALVQKVQNHQALSQGIKPKKQPKSSKEYRGQTIA